MSTWNIIPSQPPTVLTFDHPPTDAELQVYQPPRRMQGGVKLWSNGDPWTLGFARIRGVCWFATLFGLTMIAAVSYETFKQPPLTFHLRIYAFMVAMVVFVVGGFWWFDRKIASLGPLVTYHRERGELEIEGRAGSLRADSITEVVELALRLQTFGTTRECALYLVVHRTTDGGYQAERLFHAPATRHTLGDLGKLLSRVLNVPLRRIELSELDPVFSNFSNTKPPKLLSEITRK